MYNTNRKAWHVNYGTHQRAPAALTALNLTLHASIGPRTDAASDNIEIAAPSVRDLVAETARERAIA
jgi:hypothetical protein